MTQASLTSSRSSDGTLVVTLHGRWQLARAAPARSELERLLQGEPVRRLRFDATPLQAWDSRLVVFLRSLTERCAARDIQVDLDGLPAGVRHLLDLSHGAAREGLGDPPPPATSERVAAWLQRVRRETTLTLTFVGELTLSALRFLRGKARYRPAELLTVIQACGWQALPIVSLISLLVGLILAFMGAVQLRMFGAQIYVADLVGIGMTREMGAVMTGVIMAGRTGAAFAANLGTMQVNEEIDALRTLGVDPMDYLVMPRVLALLLMMPLLCVYADVMGILGGLLVGVGAFDISALQYLNQTLNAVSLTHFAIGIFKSIIFGGIVAGCGCLQGLYCGRSAAAVGEATTAAVVTAIVYIVIADGLFAVLTNILGI
ncbi:MAG: MlaE family lipid ABC transporter permease subunit [Desulfosarcinaceae bacterium]|nr:MlaE family lipid ABC transporter permease subunit [Desulfosarcinaceae bacterium]